MLLVPVLPGSVLRSVEPAHEHEPPSQRVVPVAAGLGGGLALIAVAVVLLSRGSGGGAHAVSEPAPTLAQPAPVVVQAPATPTVKSPPARPPLTAAERAHAAAARLASHLPVKLETAALLPAGSTVYVVGGTSRTGTPSNGIWQLDLRTGKVTSAGTFIEPLTGAAAASRDGVLYLAGGWTGSKLATRCAPLVPRAVLVARDAATGRGARCPRRVRRLDALRLRRVGARELRRGRRRGQRQRRPDGAAGGYEAHVESLAACSRRRLARTSVQLVHGPVLALGHHSRRCQSRHLGVVVTLQAVAEVDMPDSGVLRDFDRRARHPGSSSRRKAQTKPTSLPGTSGGESSTPVRGPVGGKNWPPSSQPRATTSRSSVVRLALVIRTPVPVASQARQRPLPRSAGASSSNARAGSRCGMSPTVAPTRRLTPSPKLA